MLCVNWRGPLPLASEQIIAEFPQATAAVAVLGSLDSHGVFVIRRVLRSDIDIRTDLARYVGTYSLYKIMPCTSRAEAYVLECELFHRVHPRDCDLHPGEPEGLNVVCPFCGFRLRPRHVA